MWAWLLLFASVLAVGGAATSASSQPAAEFKTIDLYVGFTVSTLR